MDNIIHSVDGTRLIVFPEGHIDSANAQDFEETINELRSKGSYDEIELNCGQLQYISSAGLRVILRLRKDVKAVVLSDVSPEIYEILDVTGFMWSHSRRSGGSASWRAKPSCSASRRPFLMMWSGWGTVTEQSTSC